MLPQRGAAGEADLEGIEATYPLAEAAHALGETGRTTGKIVLTVREETGKTQLASD
jgi:hypothetical protein